ncbi:MAG: hypothetical protein ACT6Q3_17460, partial [Sphingopyxis sp.]
MLLAIAGVDRVGPGLFVAHGVHVALRAAEQKGIGEEIRTSERLKGTKAPHDAPTNESFVALSNATGEAASLFFREGTGAIGWLIRKGRSWRGKLGKPDFGDRGFRAIAALNPPCGAAVGRGTAAQRWWRG